MLRNLAGEARGMLLCIRIGGLFPLPVGLGYAVISAMLSGG